MNTKKLCFELSSINGTSGDEKIIANQLKSELERYFSDTRIDPLGNVIATNNTDGEHIMLVAHMDSVGLIVRGIDEKGFLLVDKIGGIDLRVLTGAEVIVHGKKELLGIICSTPPHLSSSKDDENIDITKMAVDIGYNKEEAERIVSFGDRITLKSETSELLCDNISCGAFDDRACVAVILLALQKIKDKIKNIHLSVQLSVMEELGLIGAKTGAFSVNPDKAIVIDVGFGDDPYTDKSQTITLGKGPSIGLSPVLDKDFTDEMIAICKNNNISYQHDVMSGRTGTDADSISINMQGVKTVLLSLPLRYMHTGNEVINIRDVEKTAELISLYLLKKESENNA